MSITVPGIRPFGASISRFWHHANVVAFAIVTLPGGALVGQVPTLVVDDESCGRCRIRVDTITLIGEFDGDGALPAPENFLHVDSRGFYYQSDDASAFVRVFGPDGQFVKRIGRAGQGPGEFRRVTAVVVGPGDSLFVFDPVNGRVSLFGPDGSFVASSSVPPGVQWDGIHDQGGLLVNAHIRSAEYVGLPLMRVDARQGIVSAFGSEHGAYRPDVPFASRRVIGRGSHGSWVGWLNQYVLELWSPENRLERVVRRDADWFEEYWLRPDVDISTPPATLLRGVWQVENILWTVTRTADAEWQEAVEPFEGPRPGMFTVSNYSDYHDTIIEAIDLQSGTVLASLRYDLGLRSFLDDGIVYGTSMDELGVPRILVLQLSLDRPED